MVLEIENSQLH